MFLSMLLRSTYFDTQPDGSSVAEAKVYDTDINLSKFMSKLAKSMRIIVFMR